jgi:hypothetical protein
MSEFDRLLHELENEEFSASTQQDMGLPADFSEEDLMFAQELGSLFSAEQEEMPPYFVQTLLDAENPRFQPAESGLEHRTYVRVFRRLKLRRRLFRTHTTATPSRSFLRFIPVRRASLAIVSACMMFMLVTMVATGNAFASGLVYLLAGSHSGVVQYRSAPPITRAAPQQPQAKHAASIDYSSKQLGLVQASHMLKFPMYWPSLPDNYAVSKLYLYDGSDQHWTDGPILMFVCNYVPSSGDPHGNGPGVRPFRSGLDHEANQGQIVIWEFKPLGQGKVLQGVKLGAAHQVAIGPNNQAAIYVAGQWVTINKSSHEWAYNGSGELIYERDDVVFWIQGDGQGINQNLLVNVATSLYPFNVANFVRMADRINSVTQSVDDPTGTVVQILDPNSPYGPAIVIVGANTSQSNAASKSGAMHLP